MQNYHTFFMYVEIIELFTNTIREFFSQFTTDLTESGAIF